MVEGEEDMTDPYFKPRRCLLDLRGLVIHSFYANRPGKEATAAYAIGVFIDTYLLPILREYAPVDIIGVMEGNKANIRRRNVFPKYKEKPEQDAEDVEIVEQKEKAMQGIQNVLRYLGCPLVKTPFCEADDTIAFLVDRLHGSKRIYTVDKDLMALADRAEIYCPDRQTGEVDRVAVYQGRRIDSALSIAEELTGVDTVPGWYVTLYKSLVGDSSDQYKGVYRFGEVAFHKLVAEIGLDGMADLCEIVSTRDWPWLEEAAQGSKLLTQIYEQRESWQQCWWLASLHPEWCEATYQKNYVRLQWMKRLPLRDKFYAELVKHGQDDRIGDFEKYLVQSFLMDRKWLDADEGRVDRVLKAIERSPFVAFDYESYDTLQHKPYQEAKRKGNYVDVHSQDVTGASFCYGPNLNQCFYLPINHRDTYNCTKDDLVELLDFCQEKKKELVAQNHAFELVVSKQSLGYEFPVDNIPHDTMITGHYVDEEGDHGLKQMTRSTLNYEQMTYKQVIGDNNDMRDLSGDEVLDYGCDDSIVTAHLFVLHRLVLECEQTWDFYCENEGHFAYAHVDPFIAGVPVDFERLAQLQTDDAETADHSESRLRELLSTHCTELNQDGFNTLWPEIEDFIRADKGVRAKKKGDEVDTDALAKVLEQRRGEVLAATRYQPWQAPSELSPPLLSAATKGVGLAPYRYKSLAAQKLRDWCDNMDAQNADMEGDYTDDQARLIGLLRDWAEVDAVTAGASYRGLVTFCREIWDATDQAAVYTGTELNVGSPAQMALLVYGMLGLPILSRNEAKEGSARDLFELEGAPSTNELAIKTLAAELDEDDWRREVLNLVLVMRGCRQRESLYYRPYPLWRHPVDGNLHPQFKNCGTVTRRPSGSSPNFLQISKHKDEGKIRSCILPQNEDHVIVSIDFVQQELAILAGLAKDPNLLACYTGPKESRTDVHTMTATGIINMYLEKDHKPRWTYEDYIRIRKDKDHPQQKYADSVRSKQAKPTNFLVVYGGSPSGLATKLMVKKKIAEDIYKAFHKTYPNVDKRATEVINHGIRHGFTKTAFGNRRHAPGLLSSNKAMQRALERQVVNMEMQGTAADIAKIVCREYNQREVARKTGSVLLAVVYDEVAASVPRSKVKEYIDEMVEIMTIRIPDTEVTLAVDVSFGPNWGEQYELNGDHSAENINRNIEKIGATHGR